MMRPAPSEFEIVTIGDELLSGITLDTNSATIAAAVETLGLRVVRKSTVGDDSAAIADAVESALRRTGLVITTGGLGPTRDDISKAAVARVFGRELRFRDDLWQRLTERWVLRGPIPTTNRAQAEVPDGAEVLTNTRGTAPGLALVDEDLGLCIMLPGPAGEVAAMVAEAVVPFLRDRMNPNRLRPYRRELCTTGIAESAIAERVGDQLDDLRSSVAYLPKGYGVDIRLTDWGRDEAEVEPRLTEAVRRLRDILGSHIYSESGLDLAQVVGQLLRDRGVQVAVAESCTGGLIAKRLTDWAGSSDYFWGGYIAYDDRAKIDLLGVSETTLEGHGAVSEQTAREMAEGACQSSGAFSSIAVTGIAGPGGGSPEKPVGTVWLAVRVGEATVAKHRHYPGTRDMVRKRAAQGGLDLLRRSLLEGTS